MESEIGRTCVMNVYNIFILIPENNNLVVVDAGGRIILKLILSNKSMNVWSGLMWLRIGYMDELFSTRK